MAIENVTQHIETASAKWYSAKIEGVEYLPLRADAAHRKGTFLFRMKPGTRYTRHRHKTGEEMLLLKGSLETEGRKLKAGDFLYSPPGSIHELSSEKGCMFLVMLTEPVEIVAGGRLEDLDPQFESNSVVDPTS